MSTAELKGQQELEKRLIFNRFQVRICLELVQFR